jgi:hypothetical protein
MDAQMETEERQHLDSATVRRMKEAGFEKPPEVPHNVWNQPQELNHLHNAICHMAATGAKGRAIAEQLQCSEALVSRVVNSDAGKLAIRHYQHTIFGKDAKKRFENILPRAIETAEEIMSNPNTKDALRLRAAQGFMDRACGKATQHVEVGGSMIRSLIELIDSSRGGAPTRESAIDVTPAGTSIVERVNPNVTERTDREENPNFAPDPVDDWVAENM